MGKNFPIIGEGAASSCSVKPAVHVLNHNSERLGAAKFQGKAAVITLGCAKNHVDSEVMLGVLKKRGFEIVSDVSNADVAIVNTCGFLQSSVQESIDCVLEIAEHKKTGRLRRLVVAGCMVERYNGSIEDELPEVDAFIGVNDILKVGNVAILDSSENASEGESQQEDFLTGAARPYFLYDDTTPRQLDTVPHSAWVKISEGCNRPCTFCIIPQIRGPMRSRQLDSVVREVAELASQGVKEVNLVAQDLTDFGSDYGSEAGKSNISNLLRALDEKTRIKWIRLLYAYPLGINEELLRSIRDLPSVCNYLDVPLQHASERILRDMKRPLGRYSPRGVVDLIKKTAPEIAVRTTFIVGFPGETDKDVLELEQFVRESDFSSVGVFCYSKEQGTPSFNLPGHISEKEKNARREQIMLAQQESQSKRLSRFVGQRIEVLVDGLHEETELLFTARARFQAPEVDGMVIINDADTEAGTIQAGSFCQVEITEVAGYDLVGKVVV